MFAAPYFYELREDLSVDVPDRYARVEASPKPKRDVKHAFKLDRLNRLAIAQQHVVAVCRDLQHDGVTVAFHRAEQFTVAAETEADVFGDTAAERDTQRERRFHVVQR